MQAITIRKAAAQETFLLCDLEMRIFGESDGFITPDLWEGIEAFFILNGGEIIGSVAFEHNADVAESYGADLIQREGSLYLISVGILPEWQGKGIGTQTQAWVIAYAISQRYFRIVSNIRASNTISLRLHLRAGFKILCTLPDYYNDPVEDSTVLEYIF